MNHVFDPESLSDENRNLILLYSSNELEADRVSIAKLLLEDSIEARRYLDELREIEEAVGSAAPFAGIKSEFDFVAVALDTELQSKRDVGALSGALSVAVEIVLAGPELERPDLAGPANVELKNRNAELVGQRFSSAVFRYGKYVTASMLLLVVSVSLFTYFSAKWPGEIASVDRSYSEQMKSDLAKSKKPLSTIESSGVGVVKTSKVAKSSMKRRLKLESKSKLLVRIQTTRFNMKSFKKIIEGKS